MTPSVPLPLFNQVSLQEKNAYDRFFEYTSDTNIVNYAAGWNLERLANLAHQAYHVVSKANPLLNEHSPAAQVIPGRQWELNRLSEIKQRLAAAIQHKRNYYEHH
jgi:hypothetical protein